LFHLHSVACSYLLQPPMQQLIQSNPTSDTSCYVVG
jgi:hypothetical protein